MNKQTKAIHKALKVLNCLNNDRVYETAWVKGAINACEKALEQPTVAELNDEYLRDTNVIGLEQPEEPRLVSYALDGSTCTLNIDGEEVYFNREQPAQEPVAWIKEVEVLYIKAHKADGIKNWKTNLGLKPEPDDVPLYTHPHQWQVDKCQYGMWRCDMHHRCEHPPKWQELTDDEIAYIVNDTDTLFDLEDFARTIEQALKEKNASNT